MIIDFHTHLFPDQILENRDLFFSDPAFKLLYESPKSKISTIKSHTQYLRESKIDSLVALGFAWQSLELCSLHNDFLLSVQNKNILPFAAIPAIPQPAIKQYIRSLAKDGFCGVGELSFYCSKFDTRLWSYLEDIFAVCEEQGLLVSMHVNDPVGHNYTGKYLTPFDKLFELISHHPILKIIFAHFGGGLLFYESMPEVKEAFKNVFYDTAAQPYLYAESIYTNALNIIGSKKLLFGTDFPLLTEKRYLKVIEKQKLDNETVSNLLCNNSQDLLPITPEERSE